jgi:hypothetical protein
MSVTFGNKVEVAEESSGTALKWGFDGLAV